MQSAIRNPRSAIRGVGAFSLIELMIAIVILGIGLVMVATLFPVGIQQTQEAVELSIAPSVADQAIATLKMKLKTWSDYEATHPTNITVDIGVIDPGGNPYQGATNQNDAEFAISQAAKEQSDWPNDPWADGVVDPNAVDFPGYFPIPCDNFARLPSAAIASDRLGSYLTSTPPLIVTENRSLGAILDRDQEFARLATAIIERIRFDSGDLATRKTVPPQPEYIRTKITAFDRVFPPVLLSRANGTQWWNDPAVDFNFLDQCARRKYTWKAFVRRINTPHDSGGVRSGLDLVEPASVGSRVFRVVIVVLKRTAPQLKYPAQLYTGTYPAPYPYNVAGGQFVADYFSFSNPSTADPTLDTLFPQPWLIAWDILNYNANASVNYAAGQFFCVNPPTGDTRPGIAKLLPPGSVFIDFATGTPHRVISRTFGPTNSPIDVIQISPEPDSPALDEDGWGGNFGPIAAPGTEFAWIFPPAYDPSTNQFTEESPVVDVFTTEIAVN